MLVLAPSALANPSAGGCNVHGINSLFHGKWGLRLDLELEALRPDSEVEPLTVLRPARPDSEVEPL
jgi:hypothetical protein